MRRGSLELPVEVDLIDDDGKAERRFWDGRGAWTAFEHRGPRPIVAAIVDPERRVLIDDNLLNNAAQPRAPGRGARDRARELSRAALARVVRAMTPLAADQIRVWRRPGALLVFWAWRCVRRVARRDADRRRHRRHRARPASARRRAAVRARRTLSVRGGAAGPGRAHGSGGNLGRTAVDRGFRGPVPLAALLVALAHGGRLRFVRWGSEGARALSGFRRCSAERPGSFRGRCSCFRSLVFAACARRSPAFRRAHGGSERAGRGRRGAARRAAGKRVPRSRRAPRWCAARFGAARRSALGFRSRARRPGKAVLAWSGPRCSACSVSPSPRSRSIGSRWTAAVRRG